jgi:uncharacterized OB-fold protein
MAEESAQDIQSGAISSPEREGDAPSTVCRNRGTNVVPPRVANPATNARGVVTRMTSLPNR